MFQVYVNEGYNLNLKVLSSKHHNLKSGKEVDVIYKEVHVVQNKAAHKRHLAGKLILIKWP